MGEQKKTNKASLLSEIAYMYYIEGLSQNDIAEKMFISRSRISRLLDEAKSEGIVEINIKFVSDRNYQLEEFLKNTMGLKDARVYNDVGRNAEETFNGVCNFAAEYFISRIKPKMCVGLTHGMLFSKIADIIERDYPPQKLDLNMVQLIGHHSSPQAGTTAPDVMSRIVRHYGGSIHCLNAPIYIENDSLKAGLLREPLINETLDVAHSIDMALIGVKAINSSAQMKKQVIWAGYVKDETLDELISLGTCGHILGRAIDVDGNQINHFINRCIIGLELSYLSKVKEVICIATGAERGPVVSGATNGKYINVLITDRSCAQQVMELYFQKKHKETHN